MFQHPSDSDLGMNAAQRSLLMEAYEEFPYINDVETRLLGRATGLHPAIIDEYCKARLQVMKK